MITFRNGGATEVCKGFGSNLSGNYAGLFGGAIASTSTVTVDRSTIIGNTSGNSGGGIASFSFNALTLTNSFLLNGTNTQDTRAASAPLRPPSP